MCACVREEGRDGECVYVYLCRYLSVFVYVCVCVGCGLVKWTPERAQRVGGCCWEWGAGEGGSGVFTLPMVSRPHADTTSLASVYSQRNQHIPLTPLLPLTVFRTTDCSLSLPLSPSPQDSGWPAICPLVCWEQVDACWMYCCSSTQHPFIHASDCW